MLNTNTEFLRPEIMDVLRLFDCEGEDFTHYFYSEADKYINCIEYRGSIRDFSYERETHDDIEYKRYARRSAKLAFYELLSKEKGINFPYGALTGIRPTKLAYAEMSEGGDYEKLLEEMHVSAENINLIGRVMRSQAEIYRKKGGQDLFISLPFCPTKCRYCSFITSPISSTEKYVDAYISCIERELEGIREVLYDVRSVYIGGGTPFAIETRQLERVYKAVASLSLPQCEYTVEAGRPDVFSEEKLELSRDFGVNRICVNPQSFSDETLARIGRKHTAAQTFAAYEQAKKYGFDINIDLIAGLEGEDTAEFAHSLDCAVALSPANVTVHTLSLKAGAKLKEETHRLKVEGIGEMIACSRDKLTAAGYEPYYMYRQKYQAGGHENCGWAKAGKACVYNVDVMEEIADNIAVGANAISKRIFAGGQRIERSDSPKDIPTYIAKCDKVIADKLALFTREDL